MKNYLIQRLQEASTWRGIILFLSSCGVAIHPDLADKIISFGIGIAGIIGIVTSDKKEENI